MLLLCIFPAHAQAQNDDRYGFEPAPAPTGLQQPPMAMPTVPVQQQPMTPVYPQGQMPQQNFAPPAPGFAQNFTPPQAMVTPPGYAPVPQQAYGYVPLRPSAPQNGYAMASANGPALAGGYSLGPGDKIRVSVFGEDDLSGEYQIDSSGMVRLPLIGTVRAAGFSTAALENAIAGALAQGYLKNPRVNVEVSTYRPFYIIGAVNKPGEYPYVANMSALNAVAFGGGFTDQARQSTIFVRHEGSTTEEEVPASQITMIYPGDVVRVKTTVFWDAMNVFSPIAGPAVLAAAALH
jgi:polysaccharide export outer membrane protein